MAETEQGTTPKHPGGRPLKFKSPEEIQKMIDAYFADCDPHPEKFVIHEWHTKKKKRKNEKGIQEEYEANDYSKPPKTRTEWRISDPKPYTITGLAMALGTSRETLINYEKRDEFFDTIKAAKIRVEQYWELQLLGNHATGPIFNLKNNYGWKDKTEQDITTDGEPINQNLPAEVVSNFKQFLTEQTKQ